MKNSAILLAMLALTGTCVYGQTVGGSIQGTIADNSAAVCRALKLP